MFTNDARYKKHLTKRYWTLGILPPPQAFFPGLARTPRSIRGAVAGWLRFFSCSQIESTPAHLPVSG